MSRKIKEKDIQKAILDYLRWHKVFCWKAGSVGIYKKATDSYIPVGMKGVSDILGILPKGRFLAIEVKGPKGVLTEAQKKFIDAIKERSGVAFVARSVKDVKGGLKNVSFYN